MNPTIATRAALICLAAAGVVHLASRSLGTSSSLGMDVVDGVRGVLLGMAIALVAIGGISRRVGG